MCWSERWAGLPAELEGLAPQLIKSADAAAPHESCGYLSCSDGHWVFHPQPNIADNPEHQFTMRTAPLETAQQTAEKLVLFHSHPKGPACPSACDMQAASACNMPWLILSLDGDVPRFFTLCWPYRYGLTQRPYIHGVTDCYQLIRDVYSAFYDISLPDFPRGWGWWHKGQNLYTDYFKAAGFRMLDATEIPQQGDIFLAQIRSDTPNHGGVYLDDGRIFHHLAGQSEHDATRLPRLESAERWHKFITIWLRYHQTLPPSRHSATALTAGYQRMIQE